MHKEDILRGVCVCPGCEYAYDIEFNMIDNYGIQADKNTQCPDCGMEFLTWNMYGNN